MFTTEKLFYPMDRNFLNGYNINAPWTEVEAKSYVPLLFPITPSATSLTI